MNAYLHLFVCLQRNLRKNFLRVRAKSSQQTCKMKQFGVVIRFSEPGWHSRYSDWHTCWTVLGSNPDGGEEIFLTPADRPWSTPSLLYNRHPVSFPRANRLWAFTACVLGGTLPFYLTVFSTFERGGNQ